MLHDSSMCYTTPWSECGFFVFRLLFLDGVVRDCVLVIVRRTFPGGEVGKMVSDCFWFDFDSGPAFFFRGKTTLVPASNERCR